jgi:fructose-bisphosphate aldolase class I
MTVRHEGDSSATAPTREVEMDNAQLERVRAATGFIAALDQSGGSTPTALARYGIAESEYTTNKEMSALMHSMRTRIVTSPSFTGDRILGAILFDDTLGRTIDGHLSAEYLWNVKNIVPFVKIDDGLADEVGGVQMMRPITDLSDRLDRAAKAGVFGTKMRSLIVSADPDAISAVVAQQFDVADRVMDAGLVPIIEPEVAISSPHKLDAEHILHALLTKQLDQLPPGRLLMLKLTLPSVDDLYRDLVRHPSVLRVAALSGGHERREACRLLACNPGIIASFSRALTEGLSVEQSDNEFDERLGSSVDAISAASRS